VYAGKKTEEKSMTLVLYHVDCRGTVKSRVHFHKTFNIIHIKWEFLCQTLTGKLGVVKLDFHEGL